VAFAETADVGDPARDLWIGAYGIDDQIETNKTYRYQFRYVLLNPLLNQDVLTDSQNRQIGIESPWSAWSDPVQTDRDLYFFLARSTSAGGEPTVEVEVFRNQQSLWFKEAYTITRGVPIGVSKQTKSNQFGNSNLYNVDFRTGMTPVDVRSSREVVIRPQTADPTPSLEIFPTPQVVFADARGQLMARTVKQDALNEDYIRISKIYESQGKRPAAEPAKPSPGGGRTPAAPVRPAAPATPAGSPAARAPSGPVGAAP
jgi:hypothetical protein